MNRFYQQLKRFHLCKFILRSTTYCLSGNALAPEQQRWLQDVPATWSKLTVFFSFSQNSFLNGCIKQTIGSAKDKFVVSFIYTSPDIKHLRCYLHTWEVTNCIRKRILLLNEKLSQYFKTFSIMFLEIKALKHLKLFSQDKNVMCEKTAFACQASTAHPRLTLCKTLFVFDKTTLQAEKNTRLTYPPMICLFLHATTDLEKFCLNVFQRTKLILYKCNNRHY